MVLVFLHPLTSDGQPEKSHDPSLYLCSSSISISSFRLRVLTRSWPTWTSSSSVVHVYSRSSICWWRIFLFFFFFPLSDCFPKLQVSPPCLTVNRVHPLTSLSVRRRNQRRENNGRDAFFFFFFLTRAKYLRLV